MTGKSMNKSEIAEKAAREIARNIIRWAGLHPPMLEEIASIVERTIAESQAPQPEKTTFNFECGCFVSFFVVDGEIRSGLACCSNHEIPNISIAHFTASLKFRAGITLTSECDLCGTRIRRKIPEDWVHCNPRKQNYNMRECSVKQAKGHSTVPKATSWEFKNPRLEP